MKQKKTKINNATTLLRNIRKNADVYISKRVTVLETLPNSKEKSYLESLTNGFTDALRRSKRCVFLS